MRRHGFPLRQKTTTAQKDPSYLIARLASFVMHSRRYNVNIILLLTVLLQWIKLLSGTIWFLKLLSKLPVLKMSQ